MISKVRSPRSPVQTSTADVAVKKLANRAKGYVANSAFEGSKQAGKVLGGVVHSAAEARRGIARDFKQIRGDLKQGNHASVRVAVGGIGARLGVKLPDLSRADGWGAIRALGTAVGHQVKDVFSHGDFHGVMKMCSARVGKINDPDPSNGRIA
jgi:hypothetical protein